MRAEEKLKLHCNSCLGLRRHSILFSKKQEYFEEYEGGYEYSEITLYQLAECDGCESITLHTSWSSSAQAETILEQWPPKVSRRAPRWMIELFLTENLNNPFKQEFIGEIYSSLKVGNLRLTVLGVRALLEQVMLENIEDQGTFQKNLEEFEFKGFLSRVQREALEPVIEAGHASMHRGFKATAKEVEAILDVTENVIESIYVTKQRVSGLNIPPRTPSVNQKKVGRDQPTTPP
jgi:hypothetical protein